MIPTATLEPFIGGFLCWLGERFGATLPRWIALLTMSLLLGIGLWLWANGNYTLAPAPGFEPFHALSRAICFQQLHGKAAQTIHGRFAARFGEFSVAPETMALMRGMVEAGEADALVAERVWQEIARGLANYGSAECRLIARKPSSQISGLLGGKMTKQTAFAATDHRVYNRDGQCFNVGETFAGRLSAWTIAEDGSLTDRRVWAQLEGAVPDGICLDADGAIWVACPISGRVLRVLEGGEVTDVVAIDRRGAYACMLGGADRRTLFICTADASDPAETGTMRGAIETIRVEVPGAGLP